MSDLLLIAILAGQRVAIPAADIESVVEVGTLVPVPRAPAHVAGLSALRSRVLTVINSHAVLGSTGAPEGRQAIILEAEGHPYALLVDRVEDVVAAPDEVQPLPAAPEAAWKRVARGMVDVGGDLLLLVDGQALLTAPAAQEA